ncbi:MAG: hypothetical protein ACF8NJ_06740, partial [Phycisphaerales bacterium JB038]
MRVTVRQIKHPLNLCVLLAASALLTAWPPQQVLAQGSSADYQRAAALRHELRGKVRNESLREIWLEGDVLLYRLATAADGWEFRLLDPRRGEVESAFDHER